MFGRGDQLDIQMRMRPSQFDEPRCHDERTEPVGSHHSHRAGERAGRGGTRVVRGDDGRFHRLGTWQQIRTGLCQMPAARGAVEKPFPEGFFQRGDATANRGVVHPQIACGLVEPARARHFQEEAQVVGAEHGQQPTRANVHVHVRHWPLTGA
ncbi:hypothetical protein A5717_11130 [Mycolicibacterium porcinum]|nr:hypothetical protein A5717_11130 [Mycolicibacterium porcinum]